MLPTHLQQFYTLQTPKLVFLLHISALYPGTYVSKWLLILSSLFITLQTHRIYLSSSIVFKRTNNVTLTLQMEYIDGTLANKLGGWLLTGCYHSYEDAYSSINRLLQRHKKTCQLRQHMRVTFPECRLTNTSLICDKSSDIKQLR